MNNESIRKRVIKKREEMGWSQTLLAEKLNIGRSHMNKFEKGTLQLSLPYLKQIANVFGVSLSFLLDEKDVSMDAKKLSFPFDFEGINRAILEMEIDEEYSLSQLPQELLVTPDKLSRWKENAKAGAMIVGSCGCRYLIIIKESCSRPEHKGFLDVTYGFVNIDHAGWTLCKPTFDTTDELIEWFASCIENPVVDVIATSELEETLPASEWV